MSGAWKIWQGWINAIASVLLFIAPWVWAATGNQGASWTAWIGGLLGFVAAVLLLIVARAEWLAIASLVIGVLVFISPWVLGFTAIAGMAWTAWVLGAVMAVVAATTLVPLFTGRRQALSH